MRRKDSAAIEFQMTSFLLASLVGENVDCCHCSEATGDGNFYIIFTIDMIHSSQALLHCPHLQDESSLEADVGSSRIPLRLWDSGPAFEFFLELDDLKAMWQALAPACSGSCEDLSRLWRLWPYWLKSSFLPHKYCMKDKHENDLPSASRFWSETILQTMNQSAVITHQVSGNSLYIVTSQINKSCSAHKAACFDQL